MAKRKQSPPPEPDRHKNPPMSFRPEPALRRALEEFARSDRRRLSQVLAILLEEALAARGLWPPPPDLP